MSDTLDYMLSDGTRLSIGLDEASDTRDPRDADNCEKFCIRKHRNYSFPNELDFSFGDGYDDDDTEEHRLVELEKTHYIFWLDMYEHSGIAFSFHGGGMQCNFDTSSSCGFIAVPIGLDKTTGYEVKDYEDAHRLAKTGLKEYNQWLNGEIYEYRIEKEIKRTSEDGRTKSEWEYKDGCTGYYDMQDILDEFKALSPVKID